MKLCYIEHDSRVMYFTDKPLREVRGDDWNDAPWEHNAGTPYPEFGPFKRLIIDADLDLPGSGETNSRYCVDEINLGAVAWLVAGRWTNLQGVVIKAGDEYDDVVKLCRERGMRYFVEGEK